MNLNYFLEAIPTTFFLMFICLAFEREWERGREGGGKNPAWGSMGLSLMNLRNHEIMT